MRMSIGDSLGGNYRSMSEKCLNFGSHSGQEKKGIDLQNQ